MNEDVDKPDMNDPIPLPEDLGLAISIIVRGEAEQQSFRDQLDRELFDKQHSPESLFKALIKSINQSALIGCINPLVLFHTRTLVIVASICHKHGWLNDRIIEQPFRPLEYIASRLHEIGKNPEKEISEEMQYLGLDDMATQYIENRETFDSLMDCAQSIVSMSDLQKLQIRLRECEQRSNDCAAAGLYFDACVNLGSACEALLSLKFLSHDIKPKSNKQNDRINEANGLGWLEDIDDGHGNTVSPYRLLHEIRKIRNELHPQKDLRRVNMAHDLGTIKQTLELGKYARVRCGYLIIKWRLING